MLTNLNFDMKSFENECGVSYKKSVDEVDANLIRIIGTCDPSHKFWSKEYEDPTDIYHILQESLGIYLTSDLNFNYVICDNTSEDTVGHYGMIDTDTGKYLVDQKETLSYMKAGKNLISGYGVCDNFQQILDKYKFIEDCEQKYVISLTPIFKSHQPEYDGWRWHKWGEYIGIHEIKHEYLYDEEDLDYVFVFHIYPIK